MTPEREAEIREILSGNASPAHVRVESAAYDLLAAIDAERKAHGESRKNAEWQACSALEQRARAERAESALADVRQRCGGYPDSRVDGDGGIVAVVVRERDEARRSIACARYCLENDHGEAAVRACLDGMGMAPGIAEEYQSDLDRVTFERDEALVDARLWREQQAEIERDLESVDGAIAANDAVRALPEAERRSAIVAGAGEIWTDDEHARMRDVAATMPVFVRVCQEKREAIRERDEAQAALAALREAAVMLVCEDGCLRHDYDEGREDGCRDCDENEAVRRALDSTPATLAGQVRARVLREVADVLDARGETTRYPSQLGPSEWNPDGTVLTEAGATWCDAARMLRALADEADQAR